MYSSPLCPALEAGKPFVQLDYGRFCWAFNNLSAAGARAWLALLTYYRNDRAIPRPSTRKLARIAGVSQASARKALAELLPLVDFSLPAAEEQEGEQGSDPAEQQTLSRDQASGAAEHKNLSQEVPKTAGEQKVLSENPICDRAAIESPMGEQQILSPHTAPGPTEQKVLTPRAENTQKRAESTQQRAENAHPSISSKEIEEERNNPPPTSSANQNEEEDRFSGVRIRGEGANSQQPAPNSGAMAEAYRDRCHRIHPQLEPVREELLAFWAGKEGNRSPLAFAALQGELCRIEADPAGDIEQVREQLSVAAQKGWDFIRHKTWHCWRLAHPEPIHLSEEDLTEGGLFPELAAFERRYRATYNPNASGGEVFGAYWNYTERLKREQAAPDLQSAA